MSQHNLLPLTWQGVRWQVPGGNAFYAWKGPAKYAGTSGVCPSPSSAPSGAPSGAPAPDDKDEL